MRSPASRARLMRAATARIRSRSATDVPPNFCTTSAKSAVSAAPPRRVDAAGPGLHQAGVYIVGRAAASNFTSPLRGSAAGMASGAPIRPNSSGSPRSRTAGGTRPARSRRCTSSIRCASPTSAIASARRFGRDPLAEQPLAGLVRARRRLRRRPVVRAARPSRRHGHRHRPDAGKHRGGQPATRAPPVSRSTTAWRPPRSWSPSAASSIWSAPWRWSSTSPTRRAFCTPVRLWSRPGGGLVARHAEPHLPRVRARHRRRRVRARLAAARHPQLARFVRPSEAARALRRAGLRIEDLSGVAYDPLRDRFRLSRDPAVNYMLFATRD